jgi:hypothetical protein
MIAITCDSAACCTVMLLGSSRGYKLFRGEVLQTAATELVEQWRGSD